MQCNPNVEKIRSNGLEISFYKSVFNWKTYFQIEGRYQIPYSINVDLTCDSEEQFIRLLTDGYEGSLDPQRYDSSDSPYGDATKTLRASDSSVEIEFEEADLYVGDFHCLEPQIAVRKLALKEEN